MLFQFSGELISFSFDLLLLLELELPLLLDLVLHPLDLLKLVLLLCIVIVLHPVDLVFVLSLNHGHRVLVLLLLSHFGRLEHLLLLRLLELHVETFPFSLGLLSLPLLLSLLLLPESPFGLHVLVELLLSPDLFLLSGLPSLLLLLSSLFDLPLQVLGILLLESSFGASAEVLVDLMARLISKVHERPLYLERRSLILNRLLGLDGSCMRPYLECITLVLIGYILRVCLPV